MTTETFPSTVKICKKCNKQQPLENFYRKKTSRDGLEGACINCRNKESAIAHKKRYTPDKRRSNHLLRKYLITPAIYEHILLMQGNKCAICGSDHNGRSTDSYFLVDHCHETDQIRGLLCHPCNAAIGLVKDDIATLKNAISYISQYS